MINQRVSFEMGAGQGLIVPKIEDMPQSTIREFEGAIRSDNFNGILNSYRRAVGRARSIRKKLKNPVNKRTGKPLTPSTVKQYQSSLNGCDERAKNYKLVIRMLIFHNYMERHRTKARWVRRLKISAEIKLTYTKGLADDEQAFVEAYEGNPIKAVRAAGVRGGFKTMKPAWMKYLSNPRVKSAIRTKKEQIGREQIPGLKVLEGGGQGDGKPFCTTPVPGDDCVHYYYKDVYNRLSQRIDRIPELYGDDLTNVNGNSKNQKIFNCYIELSEERHKHHDSLVIGKTKPNWVAIRRLRDDIKRAEWEFGLPRGNYHGW